jgi:UDP-2-acetamido-2-deoxy-ribo-hexuluronate aminotransferase
VHGKATKSDIEKQKFEHDPKYLNVRIGLNSRLDTIQAAILIEKLAIFADEIEKRNVVADRYAKGLKGYVNSIPTVIKGGVSTWAQYTIEVENRDGLAAHLKRENVPTAVYYPIPIHKQKIYSAYPAGPGGLPVTEAKSAKVISLPMHPYLEPAVQDQIIDKIREFNGGKA